MSREEPGRPGPALSSRIWWRPALFTALSVALVLVAGVAGRVLPDNASLDFGEGSVATILEILATSMLAVTTFSLAAMISAYAQASSVATPRATQLLVADPTSQRALSTFLGTFAFAIVGIVALSSGYYGPPARTILFFGTLAVIVTVIVTLLRWIQHLTGFGRMADVIDRVETAASETMRAYARRPRMGGVSPRAVPADAIAVPARAPGFVTGLDMARLGRFAERHQVTVHVEVLPGAPVAQGAPLAHVEGPMPREEVEEAVRCFRVERHRTFDQDPRLGMVALAEIASRALSPAVNDPGTAIDVLGSIERVVTLLLTTDPDGDQPDPRVRVPELSLEDLVEDGLRPVARDGAGHVEVALRLQRVIDHLRAHADTEVLPVLERASRLAAARALATLTDEGDRVLVEDAAAAAQGRS